MNKTKSLLVKGQTVLGAAGLHVMHGKVQPILKYVIEMFVHIERICIIYIACSAVHQNDSMHDIAWNRHLFSEVAHKYSFEFLIYSHHCHKNCISDLSIDSVFL